MSCGWIHHFKSIFKGASNCPIIGVGSSSPPFPISVFHMRKEGNNLCPCQKLFLLLSAWRFHE